jgi:hypothetical protein
MHHVHTAWQENKWVLKRTWGGGSGERMNRKLSGNQNKIFANCISDKGLVSKI